MANDGAQVNGAIESAHVISASGTDNDILKSLRDVVFALPSQPIRDLLSNGVCARCIFRIFGLHDQICSYPSVTTSLLNAIICELVQCEGDGANGSSEEAKESSSDSICSVCLGILQFEYNVDEGIAVKKDCATDFAVSIGDVVKKEGYQIDGFSLELSLPPTVVENEQAVWAYLKKKYGSESWFSEKLSSESIAAKDFLKLALTSPLETLLDSKCSTSSFQIRLMYALSDASAKNQQVTERNGCYKRRKVDDCNGLKKCGERQKAEGHDLTTNSSIGLEDDQLHLEKVNRGCPLVIQCCRTSIYIGGRYLKYSRNVSQSRWIIDDERMGEASVEELVGGNILPLCKGDSYKFHAAGREDIDVRMLGTGRPFLLEILNARVCPSDALVKDMEMKINSPESKLVRVKNLKVLGSQGWELMREGEAEKQKQYAALVWISRPLSDDDVEALASLRDMQIIQKTPVRVLHRRSPLEREKAIHWTRVERIAGSSQYFLLHLCTQAGTYIKEFVHGDLGRTHPSVGSILKCRAEILQLDVTDVKMDCF